MSPTGYFLTARHVVSGAELTHASLHAPGESPVMVQWPELVREWPEFDLALLKLDFAKNAEKAWLVGRTGFPFIKPEYELQVDGTPVYAYGYPLPPAPEVAATESMVVGFAGMGPRVTSAVIASSIWATQMVTFGGQPRFYAIDKALNYGNSGGPIVIQETGRAFAVCIQFQPVRIQQDATHSVVIPSLYGKASSLSNIADELKSLVKDSRRG